MTTQHRPDLPHLAATLAANHDRVASAVDLLMEDVDALVDASCDGQWNAVARITRDLAEQRNDSGHPAIRVMANWVSQEAAKPDNELATRKGLIHLIGACGRPPAGRS